MKTPAGYSFRLAAKKLNWYDALKECSSDGGHLVSIHDEAANRDMAQIAKRDGFPLWTGLSRLDVSKLVCVSFSVDGCSIIIIALMNRPLARTSHLC